MNSQFQLKFLQYLNRKNENKGFTLIELLVVVIIIGVLAAIALPNLLSQIAKGRQAEARSALGTINRAQQAYRLEKASFATVSDLPVALTFQYYQPATGGATNQTFASHGIQAGTNYANDIRSYSSGVAQTTTGIYSAIICENTSPNVGAPQAITAAVSLSVDTSCPTNTKGIK